MKIDSEQRIFTCTACGDTCRAIDVTEPTGCLFPDIMVKDQKIPVNWYVDELLTNLLLHQEVT
jgi:hypothetical protein